MISRLDKVLHGSKLHSKELFQLHRVLLSGLIVFNPQTRKFGIANTPDAVATNRLGPDAIDNKLLKMVEFFNHSCCNLALEDVALNSGDKAKRMTAFLTLNVLALLKNGYQVSVPEAALPKALWSISRDEAKLLAQKATTSWTLFDYIKLKARVSYEMSKGYVTKPIYLQEIEEAIKAYEGLPNTRDCLEISLISPLVRFFTKQAEVQQGQAIPRARPRIPRQADSAQTQENLRLLLEEQNRRKEAVRSYSALKDTQLKISHTPYDQEMDLQLLNQANLDANSAASFNPMLKGMCEDVFEDIKKQLLKKYGSEIEFTSLFRKDLSGEITPVSSRVMLRNPSNRRYLITQPKVSPQSSSSHPPRFESKGRGLVQQKTQVYRETSSRIQYGKH